MAEDAPPELIKLCTRVAEFVRGRLAADAAEATPRVVDDLRRIVTQVPVAAGYVAQTTSLLVDGTSATRLVSALDGRLAEPRDRLAVLFDVSTDLVALLRETLRSAIAPPAGSPTLPARLTGSADEAFGAGLCDWLAAGYRNELIERLHLTDHFPELTRSPFGDAFAGEASAAAAVVCELAIATSCQPRDLGLDILRCGGRIRDVATAVADRLADGSPGTAARLALMTPTLTTEFTLLARHGGGVEDGRRAGQRALTDLRRLGILHRAPDVGL